MLKYRNSIKKPVPKRAKLAMWTDCANTPKSALKFAMKHKYVNLSAREREVMSVICKDAQNQGARVNGGVLFAIPDSSIKFFVEPYMRGFCINRI